MPKVPALDLDPLAQYIARMDLSTTMLEQHAAERAS